MLEVWSKALPHGQREEHREDIRQLPPQARFTTDHTVLGEKRLQGCIVLKRAQLTEFRKQPRHRGERSRTLARRQRLLAERAYKVWHCVREELGLSHSKATEE